MKKLSFYALAIAGLLFTACTTDKDVAVNDGPQGENLSDGYMSLAINLPTTSSSMRAINDDFDDGEADEYTVHDCALLFFSAGTTDTEDNAVLVSTQEFNIDEDIIDDVDKDNITTSFIVTSKVKVSGSKLYALALLNYKNIFSSLTLPITIGSNQQLTAGSSTFNDVRQLVTENAKNFSVPNKDEKSYFFMTNALLSKAKGGAVVSGGSAPSSDDIFQLAELDPSKVYSTEDKAKENPAGEIVVERALAKATLKLGTSVTTAGGLAIDVNSVKWVIDNTEPSTYIVRNPGTTGKEADRAYFGYKSDAFNATDSRAYRFVGADPTQGASPAGTKNVYYRTYWCVDPQYNSGDVGMTTSVVTDDSRFSSMETALYCHENTFDVAHQNYKNTTRAIIKVKLQNEEKFYTVNGGDPLKNTTSSGDNTTGFAKAKTYVEDYICKKAEVLNAFRSNLKEGTYNVTAADFDIEYEVKGVTTDNVDDDTHAGAVQVKSIALSDALKGKIDAATNTDGSKVFKNELTAALTGLFDAVVEDVNNNVVILKYIGGEMFYEARFKHFAGDVPTGTTIPANELAPWNMTEYGEGTAPAGGTTADTYPTGTGNNRDRNYLGRYGMVRNNWYDVEITAFNKLGYPVVPSVTVENPGYDGPDTPDDNLKDIMAVKIHVLSWAKRTQSWGF